MSPDKVSPAETDDFFGDNDLPPSIGEKTEGARIIEATQGIVIRKQRTSPAPLAYPYGSTGDDDFSNQGLPRPSQTTDVLSAADSPAGTGDTPTLAPAETEALQELGDGYGLQPDFLARISKKSVRGLFDQLGDDWNKPNVTTGTVPDDVFASDENPTDAGASESWNVTLSIPKPKKIWDRLSSPQAVSAAVVITILGLFASGKVPSLDTIAGAAADVVNSKGKDMDVQWLQTVTRKLEGVRSSSNTENPSYAVINLLGILRSHNLQPEDIGSSNDELHAAAEAAIHSDLLRIREFLAQGSVQEAAMAYENMRKLAEDQEIPWPLTGPEDNALCDQFCIQSMRMTRELATRADMGDEELATETGHLAKVYNEFLGQRRDRLMQKMAPLDPPDTEHAQEEAPVDPATTDRQNLAALGQWFKQTMGAE